MSAATEVRQIMSTFRVHQLFRRVLGGSSSPQGDVKPDPVSELSSGCRRTQGKQLISHIEEVGRRLVAVTGSAGAVNGVRVLHLSRPIALRWELLTYSLWTGRSSCTGLNCKI